MRLFDVLFLLDEEQTMLQAEWGNPQAKEMYHQLFTGWIARKYTLSTAFSITPHEASGRFTWDEDVFLYEKQPAPEGKFYFFMKRQDDRDALLKKALDQVFDGIQIYDKNACAVFFNQASRKISKIPDDITIKGRHLLDLYQLNEEISTTMTALRTHSPVINRVDHYKSNDGITIATANTAYPILRGKELLGAVVFEQNQETINTYKQKMDEIEKALKIYKDHSNLMCFTGYTFAHIIGQGEPLRRAVSIAQKAAPQNSPVLLVGETGTGKEIFAQSIHRASPRSSKRFVALNCAAIPESLIESLLFGTSKGSFTGSEDKPGYFEEASGGTLFLDELNSMSLSMQSKILRAIQENTFRRVGGQKDIKMDIRIISSCNEDPFRALSNNELRKDLFYRLSTIMIELPPLRSHMEDLEELISHHLNASSFQFVHALTTVHPAALSILQQYTWPGNIRELNHVLDYAQNVADGSTLLVEHLPSYLTKGKSEHQENSGFPQDSFDFSTNDLQNLMDTYEHKILSKALEHYGYNITKTADALGLRRQSLQYRIKKYGIII